MPGRESIPVSRPEDSETTHVDSLEKRADAASQPRERGSWDGAQVGHFTVQGLLGRGGMGAVIAAIAGAVSCGGGAPTSVASPTEPVTARSLQRADVQGVVSDRVAEVKTRCWVPALAARAASAPPSTRVIVRITIRPSGETQSAAASGGEEFPGLAGCVEQQVQVWTFPPSGSVSTVNVPLVFEALQPR